jgi:hypothetical protein
MRSVWKKYFESDTKKEGDLTYRFTFPGGLDDKFWLMRDGVSYTWQFTEHRNHGKISSDTTTYMILVECPCVATDM